MKRTIKAFGLVVILALGLMTMSASIAQALTFKLGGETDIGEYFDGTLNSGLLLVEDLGLKIKCNGGTTEAKLASASGTVLGVADIRFTGCDVVGAENTCTVNSPFEFDGTITAHGSGKVIMEGSKTFVLSSSSEFSEIEIQGICAAAETEETISGSATLTLLNSEEERVTHGVLLDDDSLQFGWDKALLHNSSGVAIIGSLTSQSGKTWSITLP